MTTQQAMEALHGLPRLGSGKPGLERMKNLLDHLGNPEKDLQCVHIAGTNGKGSLAAMTASILTAAGYKTGLTISPYVVDFRERFQIDGEMIPPRTLASLTQKVLEAIAAIQQEGGEAPVQFEAVTALALLWFAREKCDLVVLETGLGGRYDATNVVPPTLVAAITKIGYDHMELLGDTLDKIAAEKAGIIKEGCAVVCYPDQPVEAMGPILTAAAEAHTSIITPEREDIRQLPGKRLENRIDYGGYQASLGFPGAHQANHAAMAVEIALALWREYGYEISDDAILQGLAAARMPARIEVLRRHPLLLLDGCHNPDGTRALAETLGAVCGDNEAAARESRYLFLGVKPQMMADMLASIAPALRTRQDRFVLVTMAAGLSIARIQEMAGGAYPTIRIMPNTPASIGAGMILLSASAEVTAEEKAYFQTCMAGAGVLDELPEHLIDAGSAVSGCGPAYVDLFVEALADGGVACGLPRDKAQLYAAQMVLGSAKLILESGEHPGVLKDRVCSPGGSTIAGVQALEQGAFRAAAANAVIAAYQKTLELGKQ